MSTYSKIPVSEPCLETWDNLNDHVRDADEQECERLLELEKDGRARKMFLLRIHSRLNRVRRVRERDELVCEYVSY